VSRISLDWPFLCRESIMSAACYAAVASNAATRGSIFPRSPSNAWINRDLLFPVAMICNPNRTPVQTWRKVDESNAHRSSRCHGFQNHSPSIQQYQPAAMHTWPTLMADQARGDEKIARDRRMRQTNK